MKVNLIRNPAICAYFNTSIAREVVEPRLNINLALKENTRRYGFPPPKRLKIFPNRKSTSHGVPREKHTACE